MQANVEALRTSKLIMVTSNNNNKYYEMKENSNGTFTVNYGRVGGRATKAEYHVSLWNKKYNEKVRKGYTDQTHLFAKSKEDKVEFVDIENVEVQALIKDLMDFAKRSIAYNYNVTADQVTQKQVDQAQEILNILVGRVKKGMQKPAFNRLLLELFQVIPRKMNNVQDNLIHEASTEEDLQQIREMLSEEQATLDVMRGQVSLNDQDTSEEKVEKINILESMNMEIEEVLTQDEIAMIQAKMQEHSDKFIRAFKVINRHTESAYQQEISIRQDKKTELFWHGSRNENWLSILKSGLVLRPANAVITGKMFGYGLYFADKFQKSLNYTSLKGSYWANGNASKAYLALYEVHVGKQYKIKQHENWCYDLTEEKLKEKGEKYDSLFAKGGVDLINNEYIIYNQAQCTVKYFVEVQC